MKLPLIAFAQTFLVLSSVRADFHSGQRADLSLGALSPERSVTIPWGVAVDAATRKVFVADYDRSRVLRFSSAEALAGGGTAEAVLGQPDMDSTAGGTSATQLRYPTGLATDAQGRLWVADTVNHRVLRFDNAASLPTGAAAAGVFGQLGFTSAQTGAAANRMNFPRGVTVSADGTVWVADSGNHRVLRFTNPPSLPAGFAADGVLGQPNFTTAIAATTAAGMNTPGAVAVENLIFHGTATTTRLWVADSENSRVLRFDSPAGLANGAAAARVLGQTTFTGSNAQLTAAGMSMPNALAVMSGGLWVADTVFNRATLFQSAATKASGAPADLVLGQPDFVSSAVVTAPGRIDAPRGIAVDGARVWIGDGGNHRVVRYEITGFTGNGAVESGQIGQPGSTIQPPPGAFRIGTGIPGMTIDPVSAKLFVCDLENHRVLRYASVRSLTTGDAAEAVLGQPNFTSSAPGITAARLNQPRAAVMDYFGHLWIADRGNHRVLRFDNAATLSSGSAAAQVFGQSSFTSNGSGTSSTTLKAPSGLALEFAPSLSSTPPVARLWVSDSFNHRVLRYELPLNLPSGAAASGVLGQANFNTAFAASLPQPDGLNFPAGLGAGNGRLWVADEFNNRVLRFDDADLKPNGGSADGVLLQSDFTSATPGNSSTRGRAPVGLTLSRTGRLFVADRENSRVLWFDNAATRPDGAAANGVLGQTNFTANAAGYGWNALYLPQSCLFDPGTGRLWVGDSNNRRVLRFSPEMESSLTGFTRHSASTFTITVNGRVGERVEIRSSPDLVDWSTVETTLTPSSQFVNFVEVNWTAPFSAGQRFYRLQLP